MIPRRIGLGLGVALSIASAYSTWNVPAFAQEEPPAAPEAPPTDAPAGEGADPAAPAEAPQEPPPGPEEPPPAPEETPAPEPEAAQAQATAEAPTVPEPPAPASEPADAGQRTLAVTAVGLEHLPGSAFPAIYTRGITYGSLWKTFHGQQWPYMPELGGPGARVGFSGYFWNDVSNARIDADKDLAEAGIEDQNRWATQTRGVLRVTPTYNAGGDWFAQGNAEFVVLGDMIADVSTGAVTTTDDLYVRFGKWNLFDVTVGRFQGWEIANHYGMGLDLNTLERFGALIPGLARQPTDGYGLTYFWDRQNFLLGGYAVHVYPTKYLRGEVLGHLGSGNGTTAPYQMDIRPAAIFDIGWLKLKAGYEYGKATPQNKQDDSRNVKHGWGGAAQFVFNPYVEFGGSFARGYQDVEDRLGSPDLTASNTVQTFGGFLNASPGYEPLVLGVGAFWNSWENLRYNAETGDVDTNDQIQVFGAAQYALWERLLFKLVIAHASNKVEDFQVGTYINNSLSGRFRIEILY